MKSIYILRLKTHFHITIPPMHQSPNLHLPFRLSNKFHTHFSTPSPVYQLPLIHHILRNFKLLFGEDNNLWITKVFMCRFLHPPVIVSHLLVFSKIPFSNTSHLVLPKLRVKEEVSHPHKITIKTVFFGTVVIYHHDGGSRFLLNNWYTLNRRHGITPQMRAISWLFLTDVNLIR
jgi:hypothetical protein